MRRILCAVMLLLVLSGSVEAISVLGNAVSEISVSTRELFEIIIKILVLIHISNAPFLFSNKSYIYSITFFSKKSIVFQHFFRSNSAYYKIMGIAPLRYPLSVLHSILCKKTANCIFI